MSQELNARSRRARSRRQRPVLVTTQDLEKEQQAEASPALISENHDKMTAETPVETKPRRRLPSFFSNVGKKDTPSEVSQEDVAKARLARAKRGTRATEKASEKDNATEEKTGGKETAKAATKAPAGKAGASQRPASPFKTRYIMGMFIYLIAANFLGIFEAQFMQSMGLENPKKPLFNLFGIPFQPSTLLFLATLVVILIVLAKFDLLPKSLVGGAKSANKAAPTKSQNTSTPREPQPTIRQGVKGADDSLYQQYRQSQRRKK